MAAFLGVQTAMARVTPWQAGYDYVYSGAQLAFSGGYINEPYKGQQFAQESIYGYNMRGFVRGLKLHC